MSPVTKAPGSPSFNSSRLSNVDLEKNVSLEEVADYYGLLYDTRKYTVLFSKVKESVEIIA